ASRPLHLPSFPTRRSSDLSLSDAGVGAQVARAAAAGAYQNVCINLAGLKERDALLQRADKAWEQSQALHELAEQEILQKLRDARSEEHTSELQSPDHLVCR